MNKFTLIDTGLKVNRETAVKMLAQVFRANKRSTEVHMRSFDRLIKATYRGQRADLESIEQDLVITKVLKMDCREAV